MIFTDITVKTKVIIAVTNGSDMQARFMSKVMRNTGDFLLVIPFRHKGLRVNFDGKDVRVHLEVRDNEGILWSFKNCKIGIVKKDGLVYHRIYCPMKNGIENRRGGRRFYIWEKAVFEVDGMANTLFASLRDVGILGFSFAVDATKPYITDIKEGRRLTCSFKNNEAKEVTISGMIVRKENLDKYVIFGCKIDEPGEKYISFVKYLERKNVVVDAEI